MDDSDFEIAVNVLGRKRVSPQDITSQVWLYLLKKVYTSRVVVEDLSGLFSRIRDIICQSSTHPHLHVRIPKGVTIFEGDVKASTKATLTTLSTTAPRFEGVNETKERSSDLLLILKPPKAHTGLSFARWKLEWKATKIPFGDRGCRIVTDVTSSCIVQLGEEEILRCLEEYPQAALHQLHLAADVEFAARASMERTVRLFSFAQRLKEIETRLNFA